MEEVNTGLGVKFTGLSEDEKERLVEGLKTQAGRDALIRFLRLHGAKFFHKNPDGSRGEEVGKDVKVTWNVEKFYFDDDADFE